MSLLLHALNATLLPMSDDLLNLGPIDGRYRKQTEALAPYLSEYGLIRYRVLVECEYLIALSEVTGIGMRALTADEQAQLRTLAKDFSVADGLIVKVIEREGYEGIPATNHDVKAVEYFLKGKLKGTSLEDMSEWVHFALTSEDVNNLAYALMLSDALENVMAPALTEITNSLHALAKEHAALPMLARTHGQSATPTTFGKEMKVFAARLERRLAGLQSIAIQAKLNGASGNWNAHLVAYPAVDWMAFTKAFIERFNEGRVYKLEANQFTTQIECHDSYVAIFDTVRRANTILIGFSQDVWRYVSDGWITQKPKEGEVGSSTMPHKVNPIDFENAEGNFGIANTLFEHFARKLPISRLQRDLSDSTVERAFGTAFAHSLIAYASLRKGLGKISVNEGAIRDALNAHPEVLAEAVQTILRREGVEAPYEKLKALTRGKQMTLEILRAFITELSVSDAVRQELLALTPENYIGLAEKLARS